MKFTAHIEALYQELPFAKRFAAAKSDGFDYAEIWDWDNKDLDEVKRLCLENKVELTAMSGDKQYDMCNPAEQEKYIAQVKTSIDAAVKIGCKNVVIHSNELTQAGPVKNTYSQLSDTVKLCSMFKNLKELAPYAEKAGVTLIVEALNVITDHTGNFLIHTQTAAELVNAVNSPNVKVLYDAYHMYLTEGRLCETLEKYLDTIGYIHFADAPGRHEPGTGVINYKNLFDFLRGIGYEGFVSCELFAVNNTEEAVAAVKEAAVTLNR